jgi:Predicted membrane protein
MKSKAFLIEFIKYCCVGGLSFIADTCTIYIFKEYILSSVPFGLYLSVIIGFIVGLAVNYILSVLFVFTGAKEAVKGKQMIFFMQFAVIGIIGLILTEALMFLGVELLNWHYLITKVFAASIVLIWNYGARKYLIVKKERGL